LPNADSDSASKVTGLWKHSETVPVGLGIYLVFRDTADLHDFLAQRSRRFIDWESLSRKLGLLRALKAKRDPYDTHRELLDAFWESVLELGRMPRDDEFDRMLRESLAFIQSRHLGERVIKHPVRAEAERFYNFPYEALEEALANAVYHRGYDEREPIEVRINPEEIVIVNHPGPDRSVRLDQLRQGKAVPRRYRNRRIGDFLKELERVHAGTGFSGAFAGGAIFPGDAGRGEGGGLFGSRFVRQALDRLDQVAFRVKSLGAAVGQQGVEEGIVRTGFEAAEKHPADVWCRGLPRLFLDEVDLLDEKQDRDGDLGRRVAKIGELAACMGEASAVIQAEARRDGVIDDVAASVDLAGVGQRVGFGIVTEHFEQALGSATGVPIEVAGARDRIAVGPQAALSNRTVAGVLAVDGGFVDLKPGGLEDFGADGAADGGEVAGGGVGPGVECLPPDVDVVSSSEALGLAVVGKVVVVFVGDDLGGQGGCAKGAGNGGKRCGLDDGRAGLVGLVDELLANGAPPEDLGFDDIEFVVVLLADFNRLVGLGAHLFGDEHSLDEDLEILREAVSLGAALFRGL